MKTNQMTKIAEWVMDFDGLASKIGMSGYQMDEMRELFRQILIQQRSELLDLVEKEVIGEDEYSAMINGVPAQDMHDDYQNQLRRQQRQKLSALRKEGGGKV